MGERNRELDNEINRQIYRQTDKAREIEREREMDRENVEQSDSMRAIFRSSPSLSLSFFFPFIRFCIHF